jgi:hypothetical protein
MTIAALARRAASWIKTNPVYGLIVVIAPIIGLVAGVPKAWDAVSLTLGVPECVKYAQAYYYYNGHFKSVSGKWLEYQWNTKIEFNEVSRTRDYITLLNKTPRTNPRWRVCW